MITSMKSANQTPETEVAAKATRRTFSKEYKVGVLEKAERCTEPGEIGQLLRREGLYPGSRTGC